MITAAVTVWPQTLFASERCFAPTARATSAVLPVPMVPAMRPISQRM